MKFKFAVGDKVRVNISKSKEDLYYNLEMKKFNGKEVTISEREENSSVRHGYPIYHIKEDNNLVTGGWFWAEDWFEPITPVKFVKKETLTISFDPSDKAAAHLMVEEAIKNYYAPDNWTEEEIEQAKNLVCEMAVTIIRNGGDLFFGHDEEDNTITCSVYRDSFSWEPGHDFCAKPHGRDVFNVWIGKCVALCKALKKPIPDFIRFKNT